MNRLFIFLKDRNIIKAIITILLISFAIITNIFWGTLPFSQEFSDNITPRYTDRDLKELNILKEDININDSVSAGQNIAANFSSRKLIFLYPNASTWANYIIIDNTENKLNQISSEYTKIYTGEKVLVYKKNS